MPVDVADLRRAIRWGGYARVLFGAALLVAPGRVGRALVRDDVGAGTRVALRAVGIRDLLLGAGAVTAANEGRLLRRWTELSMLADGVDALAGLLAARQLPFRGVAPLVTVGGAAAVANAWVLTQLPEET